MRRTTFLLLVICAVLGCTTDASSPPPASPPGDADRIGSSKERLSADAAPAADVEALAFSNLVFAVKMYRELSANDPGNVFFSPHSISTAFGMLYAGAEGATATQMADALEYRLAEPELHHAFNALDLTLDSREREGVTVRVVNGLFVQRDYPVLPAYLDVLAEDYGAEMYGLEIAQRPEEARATINQWVSDHTNARIPELFPSGTITAASRLVLTNAVYFNAAWQYEFDPSLTEDAPFALRDGSSTTASLMYMQTDLDYAEGEGWQAVALPYAGEELALVAILPDDLASFEGTLDAAGLKAILDSLHEEDTKVWLPRFSYGQKVILNSTLQDLGMVDAFRDGAADFSGIDGTRSLAIQAAIHEANIDVTEAGTEAAAATGISIGITSVPVTQMVRLDRAFVFAIIDRATRAVLFLGRMANPDA
jgi:serpin B